MSSYLAATVQKVINCRWRSIQEIWRRQNSNSGAKEYRSGCKLLGLKTSPHANFSLASSIMYATKVCTKAI